MRANFAAGCRSVQGLFMKAELVPENGDPPIPITKDLTVVGRKEYCDVHIDDASLSKRHCVLVKTDGLLVVRDLATTNGTKVKGQRIRWAALLPDDRLTFGSYKVRIYLGPDDLPAPSETRRKPTKTEPVPKRKSVAKEADAHSPAAGPIVGFPTPSPLEVPVFGSDDSGLGILESDSDDSGWRSLIPTGRNSERDDDLVIELD